MQSITFEVIIHAALFRVFFLDFLDGSGDTETAEAVPLDCQGLIQLGNGLELCRSL